MVDQKAEPRIANFEVSETAKIYFKPSQETDPNI